MIPVIRKNLNINLSFMNSILLHKVLISVACFAITFFTIINGAVPERYDLKVDDVSPIDVIAPRDIVDKYTTERLKYEEEQKVSPQYDILKTITLRCQQKVSELISTVIEIRELSELSNQEKLDKLKQTVNMKLTDTNLSSLITMKDNEISQVQVNIQNTVSQIMDKGVEENQLEETLSNARDIISRLEQRDELRDLSYNIITNVIEPNKFFNEEETELLREKARNSVDARVYKKGEKIVGKGERLKPEHISMLNELGLIRGKQSSDFRYYFGSFLIVLLLYGILFLYIYYFEPRMLNSSRDLILLGLIIVSSMLLSSAIFPVLNQVKEFSLYLLPISVAPMLITLLIDTKLAMVTGFVLSILIGILSKGDINFIFISMISSITASLTVHKAQQRNRLMLSGFIIGLVNVLLIFSFGFINNSDINNVLGNSLHGLANGILSSIITIGILPFLEATFNIITPLKLLELSNPNQPLIKRLLMEAPGTYHHSLMVGNLAEAATEAIGGNALLARVAAYYHDIGKLKRPYFFKENQFNDNPHDRMTANLSTLVITSHPKDGEEIAKAYKLPMVIRNIIREHHGTTLVAYFYHKAVQDDSAQSVNPDDFRYDGPKPQTKESAVVMLADCVEAVVRSMTDRTEGKVEGMVRKTIRDKLEDGQLDLCDLTLKDLDTIAKAFLRVLSGFFHERIQYPDIKDDIERSMKHGEGGVDYREQSKPDSSR